ARRAGGRSVPRARLCAHRRPSGPSRLLDPGSLAAVSGLDDGRDARRGGPVPAQEAAAGGSEPVSVARSISFLGTPWSLAASLGVVLAAAGFCWVAWRRSGYRRSVGWLELLRLALIALAAALLNQPEWVEEFRPVEKPA